MISVLRKIVLPLSLVALAVAAAPSILTTPIIPQTDTYITWAYHLDGLGMPIALLALAAALIAIVTSWRAGIGRLGRVAQALAVLLAGSALWISNANVAEWAFRPHTSSSYVQLSDVDYMKADDLVLAVNMDDQTLIYPVGIVGYHHILNEQLTGEPFVVTY